MEGLKRSRLAADLDDSNQAVEHADSEDSCGTDDRSSHGSRSDTPTSKSAKKTKGRVRINMEFIDNKLRRYTTFSKRKSGIMKKAHELATLTGTQVMLLVASETGHVYTFATRKLQPILSSDAGKQLIQTCLNSPDPGDVANPSSHHDDQRMSAQGFEEPELTYAPTDDTKDGLLEKTYHILNAMSAQHHERSPTPQQRANVEPQPSSAVSMTTISNAAEELRSGTPSLGFPGGQQFTLMTSQSAGSPQLHHSHIHLPPSSSPEEARLQMSSLAQDRSICSSIATSDVHSIHQARSEDARLALMNSYNPLQRPVPGVQPFLVASAGAIPLPNAQVALFGQNNKKQNR